VELEREDNGDVGPMVERLTVTVEEAAVMLGISRTTAYGCASRNEIPTVRLGRRVVVPTAALMAMLAGDGRPPGRTNEARDEAA
jgi:excisionase family DNA binding protein